MDKLEERFFSKVEKGDSCWEWVASKYHDGYGAYYFNGKQGRAHRVSWEMKNGEIPENMYILHRCNNRTCVNPKHLYLGTHQDNMNDLARAGTLKGIGHPSAKVTEREVRTIRHLWEKKIYTQIKIAEMFNISHKTVNGITTNTNWKHI